MDYEYVSPAYAERLDELAERLMTNRFVESLGESAELAVIVEGED